jgi:hypothetical protein
MRDDVRRIRRFHDVRGPREASCQVARLISRALLRVAAWEHGGRIGGERLLHIRKMRQRFVPDAYQPRRVAGALFCVRGDRRDGIALIHHLRAWFLPREGGLDTGRSLRL